LDKRTGEILQQVELPGSWVSAIAVANNVVYAGTNQELRAYDIAGMNLIWQLSISVTDLGVDDGYLLLTTAGSVHALSNRP
jgi:outer membrane protein assembly factor BamB